MSGRGVYCVVTLTGSGCEQYPGRDCVMNVLGPFANREEARDCAAKQPDWCAPHIMLMNPPEGILP